MPPPLLFNFDQADRNQIVLNRDEIYELLPQRFEFMLLSGVCMIDQDNKRLVAFADVRPDDWWVRGHLPNRALLPGALMLEMAGQAAGLGAKLLAGYDWFMGFGGVDACKFRQTVVPPARLYILCLGAEYRPRRFIARSQGVQDGKLVFEATITGVSVH